MSRQTGPRFTPLVSVAAIFVAANVLHSVDRVRQGSDGLTAEVLSAGTVLSLAALVALALALRAHPRAPLICTAGGAFAVVGVAASRLGELAPHAMEA